MYKKHSFNEYDLGNITFDDKTNHISTLEFDCDGARFLKDAKKWGKIDSFCVLTGSNGSGKSHLLSYIHKLLQQKEKEESFCSRHIYIRSNHDVETWKGLEFDKITTKLKKSTSKSLQDRDDEVIPLVQNNQVIDELTSEKELALCLDEITKMQIQVNPVPEGGKSPIDEAYEKAELLLRNLDAARKKVKRGMINYKLAKENSNLPFKQINQILEDNHFNFKLKKSDTSPPFIGISRKDNESLVVNPKDISFGEREILYLLSKFCYYSAEQRLMGKEIKTILLDEPDRHLDPKIIANFLKLVREEFVDKGIQVIMVTHRPDTIALVLEENIFLLRKDKKTNISEIVRVSKRQALYNLTRNLRDMTSIQIKVYTEGTSDADFYCGVYHSLFSASNEQRKKGKANLEFKDKKVEEFLSRRYKLLFVPASEIGGKGGGWKQVKICVNRDKNTIENKEKSKKESIKILLDNRIYRTLGLVDNDNDQHNDYFEKKKLDEKIAVPKERYSLENFILDPIILCSTWNFSFADDEEEKNASGNDAKRDENLKIEEKTKEEKKEIAKKEEENETAKEENETAKEENETAKEENETAKEENETAKEEKKSKREEEKAIKEAKKKANMENEEKIKKEAKERKDKELKENRERFVKICENIYRELQNIEKGMSDPNQNLDSIIEKLQLSLNEYFKSLDQIYPRYEEILVKRKNKRDEDKKKKKKQNAQNNDNDNKSDSEDFEEISQNLPNEDYSVRVLVLNGFNRVFSVQYPRNFLKIRGHDLADLGFRSIEDKISNFISKRASDIYANGLTFIPEEIADTIFKLNEFAKKQNKEVKSYKNQ